MGVFSEAITALAGIHDQDLAARTRQLQRCGEAGIAAADDDGIETHFVFLEILL
jgi:hypothetical protein